MQDFVIITDSCADLSADLVQSLGIVVAPLTVTIEEKDYRNYPDNRELDPHFFYDKMRAGATAVTSAVNVNQFIEITEPYLQAGKDILYLNFSSGLSTTYNSACIAAEELGEKYPERKLYTVDTLSASLGQGLLIWYAVQLKNQGQSIEEVRDWLEEHKLNLCHWFTVDDLMHLKRGGRISGTTAILGTMLSIKPVLHMDNEGHLISMSKARGRKASLNALVDEMAKTALEPEHQTVFISHGDCLEDAQYVAEQVRQRFGVKNVVINYVGPVIGAHTGPGVVALFFMGKSR